MSSLGIQRRSMGGVYYSPASGAGRRRVSGALSAEPVDKGEVVAWLRLAAHLAVSKNVVQRDWREAEPAIPPAHRTDFCHGLLSPRVFNAFCRSTSCSQPGLMPVCSVPPTCGWPGRFRPRRPQGPQLPSELRGGRRVTRQGRSVAENARSTLTRWPARSYHAWPRPVTVPALTDTRQTRPRKRNHWNLP